MNDSILYASIAVAVCSLVYAFLTRKQIQNQKALAFEASARFDRSQKKIQKFESQASQLQKDLQQEKNKGSSLEKKLGDSNRKLQQKEQEVSDAVKKMEETLEVEARKRDHLQEQNTALTAQLTEAVKEKKEALSEAQRAGASAASVEDLKSLKAEVERNKRVITDLKKENKTWKNEVEKARQILSKVKPGELKRLKTKASRMEQLYSSMKGLREMAEERNANWETALRTLAAHINGSDASTEIGTGPLVGQALEKIGANLVIDEHTIDVSDPELLANPTPSPSEAEVTDPI